MSISEVEAKTNKMYKSSKDICSAYNKEVEFHRKSCNLMLLSTSGTYFYVGIGDFPDRIEKQVRAYVVGQSPSVKFLIQFDFFKLKKLIDLKLGKSSIMFCGTFNV